MKKSKTIKLLIAVALVLAVFLLARVDSPLRSAESLRDSASVSSSEPESDVSTADNSAGSTSNTSARSSADSAQPIDDTDVPLSGGSSGGVFVFSGDDDEDSSGGADGESSAGSGDEAGDSAEDANGGSTDAEADGSEEDMTGEDAGDKTGGAGSASGEDLSDENLSDEELVQRTLQADIVNNGSGGIIQRIRRLFGSSAKDLNANDDIVLEGMVPEDAVAEARKEDISIEGQTILAAYDIKIYANEDEKEDGSAWQPSEESITVSVRSDALKDAEIADVYHLADGASEPVFVGIARIRNGEVTFEAESFSVYIITEHEGGDAVTARVEFHYLAQGRADSSAEEDTAYYTAGLHEFNNKAGSGQTSQVLADGDTLESVEAPKSSADSRFYGWYTVDAISVSGSSSGAGSSGSSSGV